ncbi:hypothetical protein D9M71_526560 [compost metagenome]
MVSIRPTWAVLMSKLRPMSLSSATGTNSVVLKMKAAKARAMTLSQLPLPVVGGRCVGMGPFMGGNRFSAGKATGRTPATRLQGCQRTFCYG